jgi:hypothetical protein
MSSKAIFRAELNNSGFTKEKGHIEVGRQPGAGTVFAWGFSIRKFVYKPAKDSPVALDRQRQKPF